MNYRFLDLKIALVLTLSLGLSGCTIKKAFESIEPSSFITQPKRLASSDNLPFRKSWVSPEISTKLYSDIIVQAVLSDKLDADEWIFSAGTFVPTQSKYLQRSVSVADYLQDRIVLHLEDKGKAQSVGSVKIEKGIPENTNDEYTLERFVEPIPLFEPLTRGDRTLSIEVSVSELTFGDPLIYGGLFAVPVPGIANLSSGLKAPSMTIEAKFIDKLTGEVIAEIIDRRFPQVRVLDLHRLLIEQSIKELSNSFAEDIASLFFNEDGETISKRWPVSISPW